MRGPLSACTWQQGSLSRTPEQLVRGVPAELWEQQTRTSGRLRWACLWSAGQLGGLQSSVRLVPPLWGALVSFCGRNTHGSSILCSHTAGITGIFPAIVSLSCWDNQAVIRNKNDWQVMVLKGAWRSVEKRVTFLHCWWEWKLVEQLWRRVYRVLKKLKIELPYHPAIPLLGIYLDKLSKRYFPPNAHCSTIYNS